MRVPFKHQAEVLAISWDKPAFALFLEMGSGKSKILVDTCSKLHADGKINRAAILCPNGLQENWVDEIEANFEAPHTSAVWIKRLRSDKHTAPFSFLVMNIEALQTKVGLATLTEFLKGGPNLLGIDECTRIRNPSSIRTKRLLSIQHLSTYRRIMSGFPSPKGPDDLYAPFYFLNPAIMGFNSFLAYRKHYNVFLPPQHPMVRHLAKKIAEGKSGNVTPDFVARGILLPERDAYHRPIHKNMDELSERIAAYSFRKTKSECLDLPEKIFEKVYVDLTPEQRRIYNSIRSEIITEVSGGKHHITADIAIKKLIRLAQVTCNHFTPDPEYNIKGTPPTPVKISEDNPKITALAEILNDTDSQFIVWCRHIMDVTAVCEMLGKEGISFGRMTGADSLDARRKAEQNFQAGHLRGIVGTAQLGIGINLFKANLVVYYSNGFNLEDRLQSEDRAHRIGLKGAVTYVDIIARQTIDEKIIEALRSKKDVGHTLLRDGIVKWL